MDTAKFQIILQNGNNTYHCQVEEIHVRDISFYIADISIADAGNDSDTTVHRIELRYDCDAGALRIQSPENLPAELRIIEEALADRIEAMHV